jgi:Uma2 family endonuclease
MGEPEMITWPKTVSRPPASPVSDEESLRQRLLEVLLPSTAPYKMTYEEFLAWADEDTLAEWVDGEVVMYSPASDRHQDIARFLTAVLSVFVETRDLGVIRPAPFQIKSGPDLPGREPDLLFVAVDHLDRLKETHLDGPADLVVEIVSPESAGRDRGDKFYEYARGGVAEYWLIDPEMEWAEFYQLEKGRYRVAFVGREGRYEALVLPGFWLWVEWLWQEPLPKVLDVLRELELL